MGRSLERNTTLEHLYLGWNDIRDRGAYILSPVLGKNSVLVELTLESNAIGPDGGVRLALGLEKNITLQALSVAGNPIESGAEESMERSLGRNHKIVEFFEVLKAGNTERAKELLPVMPERLQGILVNHETLLEAVCGSGNKRSVAFVLKELLVRRTVFPEFSGRRELNSEETMLVVVGLKSINTSHPVRFIKNKDGDTLLHWIARESEHFSGENAVTVVSYLVSVECSPNARSLVTGLTPLHYSRTAGVALELIRNGADVGACDLQGCGIESHLREEVLDAVRGYIGHGEDYILGVIGVGSKALGGHQGSAAEQFIQTLTLPKDASFVDFSQGPWWKKVEGAPHSLPLGCFPVITVPAEDPKTGVVANIKVRVCDLDHLSELFVNDNGIIIICAFSLDSCELQTEGEASKQRQIIAKWLKKSPNTFPILAALDPSRDEEHMRKLREKNIVLSPPTDALYHARHNGFFGYSEIEVVQPFKPVLMDAVQIALRFHLAKLGRGAPLPEGDVQGCGCFVREIRPVEGCDQPRKYVKAFIFGADGSGKSSLVDIVAPKKRTLRSTRKNSDGLDICDMLLTEVDVKKGAPELVCVLYDLAGKPQYITVHEFILARHSALFVLAVDLSLDDPVAQMRSYLAPLHYHPDGPTDGCKILIVGTKADRIVVDSSGGSSSKKQNLSAAIYAKKDRILKFVRSFPSLAKLPIEFVHMSTKTSDLKEAFRDIFYSFLADIQKSPVPRAYNEASDYFESSILGKPVPSSVLAAAAAAAAGGGSGSGGVRYFYRIAEFRSLFPNISAIKDDDDYIDFLNYLYDCGQILLDQSLDFVCTQPIFMLKGYRALLGPGAGADIVAPASVAATAATSASAPGAPELEREDALARLAAVAGLDNPLDREFLLELVRKTGFCFSPPKKPNLLVFPSLYPRCTSVLDAAKGLAPSKSEIFEMTCLEWHCRSCGASGEGALPKECPNCREVSRFKQKCTAHCDDCKKALAAHEGLPMYLRRGIDVIDPTLYTGIRPFSGAPCEITLARCECLQKLKKKKVKGLCEKITYPCDLGTAVGLWFGFISEHYSLIDRSVLFSNAANFNDPYGNLVTLFFDAHSVPGQLQIYVFARGVVPELWPETFARLIDFGPRTPVCPRCAAMLILSSKQDKYTCVNGHEFPSSGMMVIEQ